MIDKQNQKQETLLPSQQAEEDFKFFRIIENTIVGMLAFIVRFLRTHLILIFQPARISVFLKDDGTSLSITRPFTFLAVSSIASSIFMANVGFLSFDVEGIRRDVANLSYVAAALRVVPTILTVSGVAIFYAYIAAKNEGVTTRRKHMYLVCYAAGFAYSLITVSGLVRMTAYSLDYRGPKSEWAQLILVVSVSAYSFLIPGVILFLGWRQISNPSVVRQIAVAPLFVALGLSLSVLGTLPSLSAKNISANMFHAYTQDIDIWALIGAEYDSVQCKSSIVTLDRTGKLDFSMSLLHTSPTTFFLKRENITAGFLYWSGTLPISGSEESVEIPVVVSEWNDGSSSVLTLKPHEPKWVRFSAVVPEEIFDKNDPSKFGFGTLKELNFQNIQSKKIGCSSGPQTSRRRISTVIYNYE